MPRERVTSIPRHPLPSLVSSRRPREAGFVPPMQRGPGDLELTIAAIARLNGCYFSVCEDIEEHAEYLSAVRTDWFGCCHLGVPSPKVRENAIRIFTPNGGKVIDLPADG